MMRRSVLALAIVVAFAPSMPAVEPSRLAPGTWVSVKGQFDGKLFEAGEISRLKDRSPNIKGQLDGFSADSGTLRFGPLRLRLDERTRLQDSEGNDMVPSGITSGQRVKVALEFQDGGKIGVRRIRLLPGVPTRLRLEGPVQSVSHQEDATLFTVLGVEIRATGGTAWEGIARPWMTIDDEDARPAVGLQLGKLGRVAGEVRFDYKGKHNFDLADQIDSDVNVGRGRVRLELIFPTTKRLSGMVQFKGEDEHEITDDAENHDESSELTLGQAYLTFHGVMGRHGSIQIGRSRFDDQRDWLFNRDMDALRLLFEFSRARFEASIAQEIIDPVEKHRDTRNLLLSASFYPGRRHSVSAYWFDRSDDFREDDEELRDFSPRLIGLRAAGEGKQIWKYWIEAAMARGSVEGERLKGTAFDAGLTLVAPVALQPSLTLGYAFGSGDEDPFDGVNRTFRQSGLQLNNGKWNGVSSFRYYGELIRPELANLHVETYALGLRPRRRTSIDIVYHRYRLDKPAPELADAAVNDRRLNLVDVDVGQEWDLVVGFEEIRHLEFELDLGYFEPGDAFLGPTDGAASARLKIKTIF